MANAAGADDGAANAGYSWESANFGRSWENLEEDEDGNLRVEQMSAQRARKQQ